MNKGPKQRRKRLNRDGLPVDATDLHEAVEKVKRNVAKRHQPEQPKEKQ